jgi:hypothetical protein
VPPLLRRRTAALAAEALIVTYPLVLMDLVKHQLTATTRSGPLRAPVNRFAHLPEFSPTPVASFVTPNVDTLTSSAWLDLGREPLVLSMPDTGGRYFAMPVYDAWTTVVATIGARTTGTRARRCVLVGPRWRGALPRDLPVVQCPTATAWALGHIRCDGESDYAPVHQLQAGIDLTPLSRWRTPAAELPVPSPAPGPLVALSPVARIARMDPVEYFGSVARLLPDNPPHAGDRARVERMSTLGVVPGSPPAWTVGDRPLLREIARGLADGLAQVKAAGEALATAATPWICPQDLGRRRSDPLTRAASAWTALGSLPRSDGLVFTARVDDRGAPLTGARSYALRFPRGAAPPARAFWSLTAYDEVSFFAGSADRRPALGDRDWLRYERDGSLVILLQPERPEGDPNWLRTPSGPFSLALRLYWPEPAALRGSWRPPPVTATAPEERSAPVDVVEGSDAWVVNHPRRSPR